MITRIELTNFMSHARTVIEPAAGLTVLVGPNNCGKSAVVAALQILCHNENSTYVLRHGEKECSVQVTTDDGHTILWKRKSSPSYEIDGQKFDRLKGAGLPEPLQPALRLPLVEGSGEDDFDVHFGAQKSPIFLLNSSSATAARFFASSSDASRLVAMQKKHKDKLAQRQREKNRLEAESEQLNAELKSLLSVPDLDRQLKMIEQQYGELLRLNETLDQVRKAAEGLETLQGIATRCCELTTRLAPLAQPPSLTPTEPLAEMIVRLEQAKVAQEQAAARAELLAPLTAPPALFDTSALARVADQLVALGRSVARAEAEHCQLSTLPSPPPMVETASLEKLIEHLSAASQEVNCWKLAARSSAAILPPPKPLEITPLRDFATKLELASKQLEICTAAHAATAAEFDAAADELRAAADGELCPICGAPLDADRLLAAAASGLGGHAHG